MAEAISLAAARAAVLTCPVERAPVERVPLAAALGRRSMKPNEGVTSAQLLLFLDELSKQAERAQDEELAAKAEDAVLKARAEAAAERARQKAEAEKAKPKPRPLKKPLPAELPRRDNVIEVPEAKRACPCCGGERAVIGYEISETLEFEPARCQGSADLIAPSSADVIAENGSSGAPRSATETGLKIDLQFGRPDPRRNPGHCLSAPCPGPTTAGSGTSGQ